MMIRRSDFVEIGYLKKLYGTDGAFILKLNIQQSEGFLTEKEPVFIDIDGNLVPFFMDEINPHPGEPIIHFDSILSREKALGFLGRKCLYNKEFLTNKDNRPDVEFLIGFHLVDQESQLNLKIININLVPGNPLLEIEYKGKSCFIPYLEEFIESWDDEKKEMYCQYPEGMLKSLLEL